MSKDIHPIKIVSSGDFVNGSIVSKKDVESIVNSGRTTGYINNTPVFVKPVFEPMKPLPSNLTTNPFESSLWKK
jgi:hypothetical protein